MDVSAMAAVEHFLLFLILQLSGSGTPELLALTMEGRDHTA